MDSVFKAIYNHDTKPDPTEGKYAIEVEYWGYVETVYVEAESKYLALAKAKSTMKGLRCRLPGGKW